MTLVIPRALAWAGVALLASLLAGPVLAVEEDDLLALDDAFALGGEAVSRDELSVRWTVAPGYYLYKSRISFTSLTPGVTLGPPLLPPGDPREDEFFGLQETYRGSVSALLSLTTPAAVDSIEIEARSQGCADVGVCYPPHRQTLTLNLPPTAATGLSAALSNAGPIVSGLDLTGDQPLPEDQAFVFETIALSGSQLLARWTIADGYYLYRDQVSFQLDPAADSRIQSVQLPGGEAKTDEHFGPTRVYYDQVEVPVNLVRTSSAASVLRMTASYQGCKEAGICYPPITRSVAVALPAISGPLAAVSGPLAAVSGPLAAQGPTGSSAGAPTPIPEQDRLAAALGADSFITLLSFFGFGLLLAFTPCVFPMIPILSGIIAGQGDQISTRRALILSTVYVLAMALTYTAAGVIAGLFGQNLQAAFQNVWVLAGFSALFVALAFSMFGFFELQLPAGLQNRLNRLSDTQATGTLLGTAIMGVLSALIVGPCVAPPLAAALIYIGQTGNALLGGMALFALAMGMGLPLIVIGTSAGRLLPQAGPWMNAIKAVFGVLLLALAIWMLERIIDPMWIMLLWGALAISSGVYLGAFERLPDAVSGWRRLWKSLGIVLVLLGALELVGAAAGGNDWLQPLKALRGGAVADTEASSFQAVRSMAEVQSLIAGRGKPALLDFYADWCVDCKRMDRYSFPDPAVQGAMKAGLALKADVTANDETDQALMRALGIIGPPAIIFFDAGGREMPAFRVIGYQRPETFARHVRAAFEAGR